MAITESNIEYRLSGGASNTDPAAALGGAMSTVAGGIIASDSLHALFDAVAKSESAVGDTEYRGIYVKNASAETWQAIKIWLSSLTTSEDDELAIQANGGANVALGTIANENTSPGGSFSSPTTKLTGISIGNLTAGQWYGIWIRRTVQTGAGVLAANQATLRAEGDYQT